MVLAAGLGTRLRPLTEKIPKPLLPLAGRPLIEWNLLLLRQHGIRDVMINLHYLPQLIEQALGDGSRWDMHIQYSFEPVLLGTGGGVKAAESFFEGEPFVVLNGDTIIDVDLTDLVATHVSGNGVATMVLREDPAVEQWGVVETTVDHRVLAINGRGWVTQDAQSPILRYMFAGVHVMTPQLLSHCPAGQPSSIIDAYVTELERGSLVRASVSSGYWSDIGTPERYTQAQRDVESHGVSLSSRVV